MIHLIFMTFSEALSPNTVMLGVEASTYELVEGGPLLSRWGIPGHRQALGSVGMVPH